MFLSAGYAGLQTEIPDQEDVRVYTVQKWQLQHIGYKQTLTAGNT